MTIRFRISICLTLLYIWLGSSALAGTSIVENGWLTVPRIDVDGFGSTELTFKIDFQGEYLFILHDAKPATPDTANSGVFDPDLLILELDEIELEGGEKYSASLNLLSQDPAIVFGVREAVEITATTEELINETPVELLEDPTELYNQQCGSCHGPIGQGVSAPPLINCVRCTDLDSLASYIEATMPLGLTNSCDAVCGDVLADYILSTLNKDNTQLTEDTLGFLELLGLDESIRKASSKLVSRLPSEEEYQLVSDFGNSGMEQAINLMMQDDSFFERLNEIFNDYLLTDKYLSSNKSEAAIDLLDSNDFPAKRWFDPDPDNRSDDYEVVRRQTNDAVAREPLELIKYIVSNNRPFTEFVTAEYMMVNPYSAITYGVADEVIFNNANDLNEYVPATVNDIPHSGVLTSPMFLNRYPTTVTNRNRSRSRVVYDFFLDTNILAIEGVRPGNAVDISTTNPTMNNPQCTACHGIVDPVASVFQNWDSKGRYRPARLENGWHTDMAARGFNGELMPLDGNLDSSVQWLGKQIAADPRFPKAITRILIKGFTGKEPLILPGENASQNEIDAYIAERAVLEEIQQEFIADNFNLKTLVREILISPYFRANGLSSGANTEIHVTSGSTTLLTPEQLERKIISLLGFEWRRTMDSYHVHVHQQWSSQLMHEFHLIYGGIDSDSITTRLTATNGLMSAMQIRMANELACYATSEDLLRPQGSRKLFLFADQHVSPYNDSGEIDQRNLDLIRENIRYLHHYLLGEELALQSSEIAITEQLFLEVIDIGREQIAANGNAWADTHLSWLCNRQQDIDGNLLGDDEQIHEDSEFIIRSWMAVLAYLLADYKFVYE